MFRCCYTVFSTNPFVCSVRSGQVKTVSRFNVLFPGETEAGLLQLREAALRYQKQLQQLVDHRRRMEGVPPADAPVLPTALANSILNRVGGELPGAGLEALIGSPSKAAVDQEYGGISGQDSAGQMSQEASYPSTPARSIAGSVTPYATGTARSTAGGTARSTAGGTGQPSPSRSGAPSQSTMRKSRLSTDAASVAYQGSHPNDALLKLTATVQSLNGQSSPLRKSKSNMDVAVGKQGQSSKRKAEQALSQQDNKK